jgi:hypothetical protein
VRNYHALNVKGAKTFGYLGIFFERYNLGTEAIPAIMIHATDFSNDFVKKL